MGVVYKPEEVEKGFIPEPGAHQKAGRFILESIDKSYRCVALEGAMVYGSTTANPSRRSDVDILTAYNPKFLRDGSLDLLVQLYKRTEDSYHVKIEGDHILLLDGASNPEDHEIDLLFGNYLRAFAEAHPEWRIKDPLEFLSLDEQHRVSSLDAAKRYAAHKERRFIKSLMTTESGPIGYGAFQRALELPSSLGRKAIDALNYGHDRQFVEQNRASYAKLADDALLSLASDETDTVELHRRLIARDNEYTELLEETIDHGLSLSEYNRWLRSYYRRSLHDARRLATAWLGILQKVSIAHADDAQS